VLAEVDLPIAYGPKQGAEYPVGGGVVLSEERGRATPKVLVDLGGVGVTSALGSLYEGENAG
jgi:hypothetical protein